MKITHLSLLALLCFLCVTPALLTSQDANPVHLQLVLPDFMVTAPDVRSAMAEFEEQENATVQLVSFNQSMERESYGASLDLWKNYLSRGDVVYIETGWFDLDLTRSGYLLDLQPLYQIDTLANVASSAADAFMWDDGRWAVTTEVIPIAITYDPIAFDSAGLSYPDTGWTLDDLQSWAGNLRRTTGDAAISVEEAALPGVIRQVIGNDLYRLGLNSVGFDFQTAQVEDTINILRTMIIDGTIRIGRTDSFDTAAPVTIEATGRSQSYASVVPVGLVAHGLAVSSGTVSPDLSYALVRFLSQTPAFASLMGGWSPYRLVTDSTSDDTGMPGFGDTLPSELSVTAAFSESLYADYLVPAVQTDSVSVSQALAEAESIARQNLAAAEQRRTDRIGIDAPETVVVAEEDTTLRFGIITLISPMENENIWQTVAEEFEAADPDIVHVELETVFDGRLDTQQYAEDYDCFCAPLNLISQVDFSTIRPLTPLMDADTTLSEDDFLGGTLSQVTRDEQIWAFPVDVRPFVMWIEQGFLESSGLQPGDGWTIEQFMSIVQADSDGEKPLIIPYNPDAMHLLLLIYALGGFPFDYSVYPPAAHFTDERTVEATQAVLNLVMDNTIEYTDPLMYESGSGIAPIIIAPMDGSYTSGNNLIFILSDTSIQYPAGSYQPFTFPVGRDYTPIAYDLGTAYISSQTTHPEQCYRFISAVSQEPGLFSSSPARLSTIFDPNTDVLQPAETVDFYRSLARLADSPDLVVPEAFSYALTVEAYTLEAFYKAIDLAVSDGLELDTALFEAQQAVEEFQACLDSNPESTRYSRAAILECVSPNPVIAEPLDRRPSSIRTDYTGRSVTGSRIITSTLLGYRPDGYLYVHNARPAIQLQRLSKPYHADCYESKGILYCSWNTKNRV